MRVVDVSPGRLACPASGRTTSVVISTGIDDSTVHALVAGTEGQKFEGYKTRASSFRAV